jgi:hypothetical protein
VGIFCKVFERKGEQALVMKGPEEEGLPLISVCFEASFGLVTATMGYQTEALRDRAFDAATEGSTWALVDAHREEFDKKKEEKSDESPEEA